MRHRQRISILSLAVLVALLIGAFVGIIPGNVQTVRAASLVVNTNADNGPGNCTTTCTLRDAITAAANGDTITFQGGLASPIILTAGTITIAHNITLQGPGAATLAVDGNHASGIFVVNAGTTVSISGLTLQNSSSVTNSAVTNSGTLTLTSLTLSSNVLTALSNTQGGGAIYNNGGTLTIISNSFSGNTALYGGAIFNNAGTITISGSTFFNNGAVETSSYGDGGAIDNYKGSLTVDSSSFAANTKADHGGAINNQDTVTITNSTFIGNLAALGGAIANPGPVPIIPSMTISNSTFYGNSAGSGGAIYDLQSILKMGNSTIVGNSATDFATGYSGGGGLNISGQTYLGSNLIAHNTAIDTHDADIQGPVTTTLGYNVVGIGEPNNNLTLDQNHDIFGWYGLVPPVDGLVNPPANNGGATQTTSLQNGSPAIGHGFCAWTSVLPVVTTDQRGVARQNSCDAGAYESNIIPILPVPLPAATGGKFYSQALTSARGDGNYTFSLTGGSLPSGITLNSAGVISGTPPFIGYGHGEDYLSFTLAVTDISGHSNFFSTIFWLDQVHPLKDMIGIFRKSTNTFYLRNSNTTGYADSVAAFNPASKPYPVVGDWNGDGLDTIGIYNQNTGVFYLRDSNTSGAPNYTFTLGSVGDIPLSGRWTAAATHAGAGVFRPSNGLIYLKNQLTTGFADFTMVLGIPGDIGVAGDWSGQGFDTPGVYRPARATFYLSNKTSGTVFADYTLVFGTSGDVPIAGDWIGQGHDGIGIFRPTKGNLYLRNTLTTGFADNAFNFGSAGDMPIAGHWSNGTSPSLIVSPTPHSISTDVPPSFDG